MAAGSERRLVMYGSVSGSDMVDSRLEGRRRWWMGADCVDMVLSRFISKGQGETGQEVVETDDEDATGTSVKGDSVAGAEMV